MDKRLKKYYGMTYRRGKSAAARAIDLAAGTAGVLLVSFIFIWSMGAGIAQAAVFSISAAAGFVMISCSIYKSRLNRHIRSVKKTAEDELALERMVMDDGAADKLLEIIEAEEGRIENRGDSVITPAGVYYIKLQHPLCKFSADDAMCAVRSSRRNNDRRLNVITTAEVTEEATSLVKRYGGSFCDEYIEKLKEEYIPTEEEVEEYLISKYEERRASSLRLKQAFTEKGKAKSWAACAGMLVLWGIIFGKGALYFTAAGICAALAGYSAATDNRQG